MEFDCGRMLVYSIERICFCPQALCQSGLAADRFRNHNAEICQNLGLPCIDTDFLPDTFRELVYNRDPIYRSVIFDELTPAGLIRERKEALDHGIGLRSLRSFDAHLEPHFFQLLFKTGDAAPPNEPNRSGSETKLARNVCVGPRRSLEEQHANHLLTPRRKL